MNISKTIPSFFASLRRVLALAAVASTLTFAAAGSARAGLISTVVEGPANAPFTYNLTLEFGNGNYYNFILRSTAASYTGYDFINTVALLSPASTRITLDQRNTSFGNYLNGVTIGNDTNSGFTNNSYWTYWTGSATTPVQWTYSQVGEDSRTITPGQADGWVYSSSSTIPPQATAFAVPEPSTWALLAASALLIAPAIRRRAASSAPVTV